MYPNLYKPTKLLLRKFYRDKKSSCVIVESLISMLQGPGCAIIFFASVHLKYHQLQCSCLQDDYWAPSQVLGTCLSC